MWYISKLLILVIITHNNCNFFFSSSLLFFPFGITIIPHSNSMKYTSFHTSIYKQISMFPFNSSRATGSLKQFGKRWDVHQTERTVGEIGEKGSPCKVFYNKDPCWWTVLSCYYLIDTDNYSQISSLSELLIWNSIIPRSNCIVQNGSPSTPDSLVLLGFDVSDCILVLNYLCML